MLEIPMNQNKPEKIKIIKGVSERLNYYIPKKESCIYDLRYNFPLNYFSGISACLKHQARNLEEKRRTVYNKKTGVIKVRSHKDHNVDELKFSTFSNRMLGISKQQFGTL